MTARRAGATTTTPAVEPRWIQIGPARIFHYDVGGGPAVVLLHGWDHHAEAWVRNIVPLAEAGYRVVAPDLPGFGRSGMPRIDYTLRGYSRLITRMLDALDIDRAVFVGSSMGGAVSIKTAVDHPERVGAVVGVDPAGIFDQAPRFMSLLSSPFLRFAVRPFVGRRRIVEESHKNAYFDRTLASPLQVDLIAQAHRQPGYREHFITMAGSLTANPMQGRLWDALPSLDLPVLIVWGRQDRALSVQMAYRAAQRVPRSELVIYDRCGHLPMYEKADEFNRDLTDFLQRRL